MPVLSERIEGDYRNLAVPSLFQAFYHQIINVAGAACASGLRFHEGNPIRSKPPGLYCCQHLPQNQHCWEAVITADKGQGIIRQILFLRKYLYMISAGSKGCLQKRIVIMQHVWQQYRMSCSHRLCKFRPARFLHRISPSQCSIPN